MIYSWWIIKKCGILKNYVFMTEALLPKKCNPGPSRTYDKELFLLEEHACFRGVYMCAVFPLGTCPLCPQSL